MKNPGIRVSEYLGVGVDEELRFLQDEAQIRTYVQIGVVFIFALICLCVSFYKADVYENCCGPETVIIEEIVEEEILVDEDGNEVEGGPAVVAATV